MPLTEEQKRAFVGKKYDYYQQKWYELEQKKGSSSWNWGAFCFGMLWMAYRKMYFYCWICIAIIAVDILCEAFFNVSAKAANVFGTVIGITIASQGNSWYKLHVEKKITEFMKSNPPAYIENELLKEQGGTSFWAVIGFMVVFFVIVVILGIVIQAIKNS